MKQTQILKKLSIFLILFFAISLFFTKTIFAGSPSCADVVADPTDNTTKQVFRAQGCSTDNVEYWIEIGNQQGERLFVLRLNNKLGNTYWTDEFPIFDAGSYSAILMGRDRSVVGAPSVRIDSVVFFVNQEDVTAAEEKNKESVKANITLCDSEDASILTAIGCIPFTDTTSLAARVSVFGIGIAGGVAILLIIVASFMIATSQGDPRRLQSGRELLFAAIIGLIMVIISGFILRILGIGILGIF